MHGANNLEGLCTSKSLIKVGRCVSTALACTLEMTDVRHKLSHIPVIITDCKH